VALLAFIPAVRRLPWHGFYCREPSLPRSILEAWSADGPMLLASARRGIGGVALVRGHVASPAAPECSAVAASRSSIALSAAFRSKLLRLRRASATGLAGRHVSRFSVLVDLTLIIDGITCAANLLADAFRVRYQGGRTSPAARPAPASRDRALECSASGFLAPYPYYRMIASRSLRAVARYPV